MAKLLKIKELDGTVTISITSEIDLMVHLSRTAKSGVEDIEIVKFAASGLSPKTVEACNKLRKNRDYSIFKDFYGGYQQSPNMHTYMLQLRGELPHAVQYVKFRITLPSHQIPKLLEFLLEINSDYLHKELKNRLSEINN